MPSLSGLAAAILIATALHLAGHSAARDLRPSEHGLVFQASPPANSSPEMRSFFSTAKGSSPSDAPLQNATESLPPSWWGVGGGGGGGRRQLRRALTTASLVCGMTGGALLVASALLYLFKQRRKQSQNESFRASNNNNNSNNYLNDSNNKLQIVPVVRNS